MEGADSLKPIYIPTDRRVSALEAKKNPETRVEFVETLYSSGSSTNNRPNIARHSSRVTVQLDDIKRLVSFISFLLGILSGEARDGEGTSHRMKVKRPSGVEPLMCPSLNRRDFLTAQELNNEL
ncbi:Uncharacterized protein Fot_12108 [Forsythia ovata]|uniref:Uncharacterized protein n=1 Tax=Forsythia ovata TaxID=205694 RepID=A0ABD1WPF9_9LAMI